MLYIKLFIEREKNIGQSAPECPFNYGSKQRMCQTIVYQHIVMIGIIFFCHMLLWYIAMWVNHIRYALANDFRMLTCQSTGSI